MNNLSLSGLYFVKGKPGGGSSSPSYIGDIYNPNYLTYHGMEYHPQATNTVNLDSSTKRAAGMVRTNKSGNVTKLEFLNWSHTGAFQSCTVELRSDNAGDPGTLLGSASVTPSANFSWNSVTLGTPVAVTENTKYWVVIYGAGHDGSNVLEIRGMEDTTAAFSDVFDVKSSTDSGATWSDPAAGYNLCVGFGYDDGAFRGLAYGDFDNTDINDSTERWGEYFTPDRDFTASSVSFRTKKSDAGTPSADLTYYIEEVGVGNVRTGTLVTAAAVTTSFVWYTAALSSSLAFSTAKTYRVGLSGPGSGTRFQMLRHKTTGTGNGDVMSFQGTVGVLTNGSSQDNTRDMSFRLHL